MSDLSQQVFTLLGPKRDTWRDDPIISALGAQEVAALSVTLDEVSAAVVDNTFRLREALRTLTYLAEDARGAVDSLRDLTHPSLLSRLLLRQPLPLAEACSQEAPRLQRLALEAGNARTEAYAAWSCLQAYEPKLEEDLHRLTDLQRAAAALALEGPKALRPELAERAAVTQGQVGVGRQALEGLRRLTQVEDSLSRADDFVLLLSTLLRGGDPAILENSLRVLATQNIF